MKKIITVLLIMCLALMMCSCGKEPEEPKEPDFMENYWGESQKKVTGKAGDDYAYAADDVILYEGPVNGVVSEIYYGFVDGKLVSGDVRYATGEDDFTLEKCIALFGEISAELTARYGAELDTGRIDGYKEIDTTAKDYEEHKTDEDKYQIYYHILSYIREWNDGTSYVKLSLDYSSNRVNMLLHVEKVPEPAS
ncbi:MAG: hypothetical protein IKE27_05770 [Oscillospiraceae bacterium]|nr:hypothetical protein [Oscillospiraceae bacterium]